MEEVVAFGDDERDVREYGNGPGDRLLQGAVEDGGVDRSLIPGRAQASEQGGVSGRVEGVGGALAAGAAEAVQFGLREMEAVHRDEDGEPAEPVDQPLGERGLPGAGRPRDAEDAAAAGDGEPAVRGPTVHRRHSSACGALFRYQRHRG